MHLDPPALIAVTDRGLQPWQAGATRGPGVTIRPGHEGDAGLLAHELTHVWRWWLFGAMAAMLIAFAGMLYGPVEVGGVWIPAWAIWPLGFGFNSAMYKFWPDWRLAEEVAAYAAQATHYPDDRRLIFAGFIADHYGLDISIDEAERMLK